MLAGGRMGMKLILVRTGRGNEALQMDRNKWKEYVPIYIAENLLDAVRWIIRAEKNNL